MPDLGNSRTQFFIQTKSHSNTTSDQVLISFSNLKNLVTLHMDMTLFTGDVTVKVFEDTTDLLSTKIYPTDYDTDIDIIVVVLDGAGQDMNVTLNTPSEEGTSRNVVITSREETRN